MRGSYISIICGTDIEPEVQFCKWRGLGCRSHRFKTFQEMLRNRWVVSSARIKTVYRSSSTELDADEITSFLEKQLVKDMLALKLLQMGLWLVKDNAAQFDRAWIAARQGHRPRIHCNTWAGGNNSASGSIEPVAFSVEELRSARQYDEDTPTLIRQSDSPTMLESGTMRFQRFQYFLGAAWDTFDVAVKLAHYCSGLEALVSSSQQELSHQVSERVAVALASPGPRRVSIYRLVKKAYGYRSKTVHGAAFKSADMTQLRQCSIDIDQLCRELCHLYSEEEGSFRKAVEGTVKLKGCGQDW